MLAVRKFLLACTALTPFLICAEESWARIHGAPVVIPGHRVKALTHYPIKMYRLFRTLPSGSAEAIPFQIDEINEWGDYVLPEGNKITANSGNGIFDLRDEISFMGDDVGPSKTPTKFSGPPPSLLYEIRMDHINPKRNLKGSVFVGIYFQKAPPLSQKKYVNFYRKTAEVITSRYRYGFDTKNWLVSRRVEMLRKGSPRAKPEFIPLLESTTFYMKADLKYFLTIEANHRSINSELEAWKVGPVRSIVRINFYYSFLKLNFELGMYTEISFFTNAVFLPAILYNPLDGPKSLNRGSGFSYGMALRENPNSFRIETNMPPYKESGFLDMFKKSPSAEELYWIMASGADRMLYMEIALSEDMRRAGAMPQLYRENIAGRRIKNRGADDATPLGKSPVNMALHFDMTKFTEGEHTMAFRLFFENDNNPERLRQFKELSQWRITTTRIKR